MNPLVSCPLLLFSLNFNSDPLLGVLHIYVCNWDDAQYHSRSWEGARGILKMMPGEGVTGPAS
jgi:hypothetical protein